MRGGTNLLGFLGLAAMLAGLGGSVIVWPEFVLAANAPAEPTDVTIEGLAGWDHTRPRFVRVRDYTIFEGYGAQAGPGGTIYFGLCPADDEDRVCALIALTEKDYYALSVDFNYPPLVGRMHAPAYSRELVDRLKNYLPGSEPDKLWRLSLNDKPWPVRVALGWLIAWVALFTLGAVATTFFFPAGDADRAGMAGAMAVAPGLLVFLALAAPLAFTPPRWRLVVGAATAAVGAFALFGVLIVTLPISRLALAADGPLFARIVGIDLAVAATVVGLLFVVTAPNLDANDTPSHPQS